jgi:hypothetical protein
MEDNSIVGTIIALLIGPVLTIVGVRMVRWNREIGSSQRQSNIQIWGWDWGSERSYWNLNIVLGVLFAIGGIGVTIAVVVTALG